MLGALALATVAVVTTIGVWLGYRPDTERSPDRRVCVRVLRGYDGRAVSSARVGVARHDVPAIEWQSVDRYGRAIIDLPRDIDQVGIIASGEGLHGSIDVTAADCIYGRSVTLYRPGSIRVRVLRSDGGSAAGLGVRRLFAREYSSASPPTAGDEPHAGVLVRAIAQAAPVEVVASACITNSEGGFRLVGLEPGDYELRVGGGDGDNRSRWRGRSGDERIIIRVD